MSLVTGLVLPHEEHPQPIVVAVAEAAGDAAVELDEAVDRFGSAVARTVGVEVAEELAAPLTQRLAEACDLGDGAGGERGDDLRRDRPPGGMVVLVVGGADLLSAPPGDFDVPLISGEC